MFAWQLVQSPTRTHLSMDFKLDHLVTGQVNSEGFLSSCGNLMISPCGRNRAQDTVLGLEDPLNSSHRAQSLLLVSQSDFHFKPYF